MEMNDIKELKEWALHEIELAKADLTDQEDLMCYYDKARDAFISYVNITKNCSNQMFVNCIFKALFEHEPLTPIEDVEEEWDTIFESEEQVIYRSKRRSTLNKCVSKKQANVKFFTDTGRYDCIDINTSNVYKGGIGAKVLDEMIPITMPYSPSGKIKVFTEDFMYHKTDKENENDTIAVLYFKLPNGQMKEIKRFFKEDKRNNQIVEIKMDEYMARKRKVKQE